MLVPYYRGSKVLLSKYCSVHAYRGIFRAVKPVWINTSESNITVQYSNSSCLFFFFVFWTFQSKFKFSIWKAHKKYTHFMLIGAVLKKKEWLWKRVNNSNQIKIGWNIRSCHNLEYTKDELSERLENARPSFSENTRVQFLWQQQKSRCSRRITHLL